MGFLQQDSSGDKKKKRIFFALEVVLMYIFNISSDYQYSII